MMLMNGEMVQTLHDATAGTCGAKAASLGLLSRTGLPVPEGFVVPFAGRRAALGAELRPPDALRRRVAAALARLGDPPVAVRSSATSEDTAGASAAGQYESILAVRGASAVMEAIEACWRAAASARVAAYRNHIQGEAAGTEMAVLVQRLVDADVSGVMFTPARSGDPVRIEASWGLGRAVVEGMVTPDSYMVDRGGTVRSSTGLKSTRLDRAAAGAGVVARDVAEAERSAPTLDDAAAARLAELGHRVAGLLGEAQDIEWALAGDTFWLLQARPVTAALPAAPDPPPDGVALRGTPGSHGVATGNARIVRGPRDFARVRTGDIIVCPHTDPAWTPLFTIASGVVTEVGGALSHAAIVAREYGLPAVLGVPRAAARIPDGARLTLDGTAGTVTPDRATHLS